MSTRPLVLVQGWNNTAFCSTQPKAALKHHAKKKDNMCVVARSKACQKVIRVYHLFLDVLNRCVIPLFSFSLQWPHPTLPLSLSLFLFGVCPYARWAAEKAL